MDYSGLQTHFANYLHRNDLSGQLDTFISMVQAKLNRQIETLDLDVATTLTTDGTSLVDLPTDFLELKSIRVASNGGYRTLEQKSMIQMAQVLESYGGTEDVPYYYARYGGKLEIAPTPETGTEILIVYKAALEAFVNSTDTDFILTKYPEAYIYGVMHEAALYTRDEAKIGFWGGYFSAVISDINEQGKQAEWSGAPRQIVPLGTSTP